MAEEIEDKLNSEYWNTRYVEDRTGWDIGYANNVLIDYVRTNCIKNDRILIPGAGRAYEAVRLHQLGFTNVYALDFAPLARKIFLAENQNFPRDNYLQVDFFELNKKFDLVLEQTFFCALLPNLRESYVEHMHNILSNKGKIYGLMFEMDKEDGPPYGGTKDEYRRLFSSKFNILTMRDCTKSIGPRLGKEIEIEFQKK